MSRRNKVAIAIGAIGTAMAAGYNAVIGALVIVIGAMYAE